MGGVTDAGPHHLDRLDRCGGAGRYTAGAARVHLTPTRRREPRPGGYTQRRANRYRAKGAALTYQQIAALALVAAGNSYAEGGAVLGLTRHAFNMHVNRARDALGARTTTHAVVLAILRGLIPPKVCAQIWPGHERGVTT